MSVDSQSENLETEFLNIIEDDENYSSVESTPPSPQKHEAAKVKEYEKISTKKIEMVVKDPKIPLKSPNNKNTTATDDDFDFNTLLSIKDTDLHKRYKIVSEPTSKSSSPVWKHYGLLHSRDEDELIDKIHFYCIPCFEESKSKRYQKSTSTGNLIKHLVKIHNINLSQTFRIKQQKDGIGITVTKQEPPSNIGNKSDCGADDDADDDGGAEKKPTKASDDEYDYLVNDINEIIICEVAKRPQLYDNRLIHHRGTKHHIRRALWVEVYTALNGLVTYEKLQNIWKNIRDRYNKIKRDTLNGLPPKTKYRYFDLLKFLDDINTSNVITDDSLVDNINTKRPGRPRTKTSTNSKTIAKIKNNENEHDQESMHSTNQSELKNILRGRDDDDDDSYSYTINNDYDDIVEDGDDGDNGGDDVDDDDNNNNDEYHGEAIVEHLDEDVHVKNSNDIESAISIFHPNYSNQNEQERYELKGLTIEDQSECENDDGGGGVNDEQEYKGQNEIDEILEEFADDDDDDINSDDACGDPIDETVNTEHDQYDDDDDDDDPNNNTEHNTVSYCEDEHFIEIPNTNAEEVPPSNSIFYGKPVTSVKVIEREKPLTKLYLKKDTVDNHKKESTNKGPVQNRSNPQIVTSNNLKRNLNVSNYDFAFKKFIVDENYVQSFSSQSSHKKGTPQITDTSRNKVQQQPNQLEKTNILGITRINMNDVKFETDESVIEPGEILPSFLKPQLQLQSPLRLQPLHHLQVKSQVEEHKLPISIPQPPPPPPQSPLTQSTPNEYQQNFTITNIEPPYYDLNRELDEYDLFGNLVAKVMKNMKRKKSRILQTKILELIQVYDDDNAM